MGYENFIIKESNGAIYLDLTTFLTQGEIKDYMSFYHRMFLNDNYEEPDLNQVTQSMDKYVVKQ